MRGPQDKDQATIGPKGTRPEDHTTKGAEDQKALEFILYVSVHMFYIFVVHRTSPPGDQGPADQKTMTKPP